MEMIFGGLVIWSLFGVAAALIASSRGGSGLLGFISGVILGPIGLVLALLAGEPCPHCRSRINPRATVCPKCHKELDAKRGEAASAGGIALRAGVAIVLVWGAWAIGTELADVFHERKKNPAPVAVLPGEPRLGAWNAMILSDDWSAITGVVDTGDVAASKIRLQVETWQGTILAPRISMTDTISGANFRALVQTAESIKSVTLRRPAGGWK